MTLRPLETQQLEPAPAVPLYTFQPGDATMYRFFFGTLNVPNPYCDWHLFGFGVGDGPYLSNYFQPGGYLSFDYFAGRMIPTGGGHKTAIYTARVGYRLFLYLRDGTELTPGSDGWRGEMDREWRSDWKDQLPV